MLIPGLFPQRTIYLTKKSTVTTSINVLQYLDRETTLFHVHNSPIFVRVLNSEILLSHNEIVTRGHSKRLVSTDEIN